MKIPVPKVVMISGAAGNLGSAVAMRFMQDGASLVLPDRATGRLERLLAGSGDLSEHLLMEDVDVGEPQDMRRVVEDTLERYGRIDALVNTVGGYQAGRPLHETPFETWEKMMNVNARTVWVACQAVIPVMLRQKAGRIVNVSARAALAGAANASAYSAAKSAVMRLTESMAAELKHEGITVNCVLPGTIDTPQNREAMPKADFSRWVAPASIANVIYFLLSDAAKDISGAAVPVFGRS